MKFIADLHIHSHYSMATSKLLTPEYLDLWAKRKGISVLGTGDFTHPAWINELKAKTVVNENNLLSLKKDYLIHELPIPENKGVNFLLSTEINCIYKEKGKTRKVHNILLAPDFETVEKINKQLTNRGFNLKSDGRPIVKLSSKNLLEMTLDISEDIILIPAHIWTPWYSLLGSKNGYSTLEECFEDLTQYIYAVETGLSSDYEMNRRVDFLSNKTLLSNSDAHSPDKIGRNATIFDTTLGYFSIIEAIKDNSGNKIIGTIDSYPQEGKYYYDGHRKCSVKYHPAETKSQNEICPICNKNITKGVLNRIQTIAGATTKAEKSTIPHIVPLQEIIAGLFAQRAKTKRVEKAYIDVIENLGAELKILLTMPVNHIVNAGYEQLGVAIRNMRNGNTIVSEGFDGSYGSVYLIPPAREPQAPSIVIPDEIKTKKKATNYIYLDNNKPYESEIKKDIRLTEEQIDAVDFGAGNLIITGGKYSGKTEVLLQRCARLLNNGIDAERILFILPGFKALKYVHRRLQQLTGNSNVALFSLHLIGEHLLSENPHLLRINDDFMIIDNADKNEIICELFQTDKANAQKISQQISKWKRKLLKPNELSDRKNRKLFYKYERYLTKHELIDKEDLIYKTYYLLANNKRILQNFTKKYDWLFIDDFQYLTSSSEALVNLLLLGNFTGFTCTKQSINKHQNETNNFAPNGKHTHIHLKKNYLQKDNLNTFYRYIKQGKLHRGVFKDTKTQNISIICSPDAETESHYITNLLSDTNNSINNFHKNSYGSSIYYRSKNHLGLLIKYLDAKNIAYRIIENNLFFEQPPVKQIVQLLKSELFNHNSYIDNYLTKHKIKHLPRWVEFEDLAKDKSIRSKLITIIDNYFEHLKPLYKSQLQTLLSLADEFNEEVDSFIRYISLSTKTDAIYASENEVLLIHSRNNFNINTRNTFLCLSQPLMRNIYQHKEMEIIAKAAGNTIENFHILMLLENENDKKKVEMFTDFLHIELNDLSMPQDKNYIPQNTLF